MAISLFLFRRDFVAFTGRDAKARRMGTGVMIKPSVVLFFADKIATAVLAFFILCEGVIAASAQYSVDGLAIGTRLNFDSASYRAYKCTPSDQFRGLTWCQKTTSGRERRGPYSVTYSLLHSGDGKIVYVNRSQEPSYLNSNEADKDIQGYSLRFGESPHIMKMPHRSGLPDGLITIWGKITLAQLDQETVKGLSEGKNPKKGLLIDFLGNFVRSAKEGLPIYRIENGPGFVWRASFDLNGRGSFRFAAIDASEFSSLSPALVTAQLPSGSGGDAPVTECDTYAASAVDPYRKTAGVPEEKLDASLAIPACASAIRKFPNSPRLKYQLGRGYWKSNNFGEAIIWFRQAAEYRYAPAEALLGYMFQFGQGVPQNYREAFSWYSQAANQGFAPAQKNLGLFYEMGLGLTKDILQASEWYRKAAEQGNIDAQNHLKRLSALIIKENAEENATTETVRRETEKMQ
jgi:hypothetical protein